MTLDQVLVKSLSLSLVIVFLLSVLTLVVFRLINKASEEKTKLLETKKSS